MSDAGYDAYSGATGTGRDGKEQIGVPNTSGTVPANHDPSRSALHYGEEHRGEAHHGPQTQDAPVGSDAAGSSHGAAQGAGAGSAQSADQAVTNGPALGIAPSQGDLNGLPQAQTALGNGGAVSSSTRVELGAEASPSALAPSSIDNMPQGRADEYSRDDRPAAAGEPSATEQIPAATQNDDRARTEDVSDAPQSDASPPITGSPQDDPYGSDQQGESSGAAMAAPDPVVQVTPNEAPTDVTLSNGAIAASTEGAVVGTLHAVDADAGDSHSYTLSDDRFEVSDGVLRLREGHSLDNDTGGSVTIDVTATDPSGNAVSKSFEIEIVEMPGVSQQSGFHARYFDVDHRLGQLDEIDWTAEPTHEELVGDINYANGTGSFWEDGATDTFGAQITGHVEVDEGGTFTFNLGGDDGAVLYVNGVEVIENDGLHSYHTRSGEVDLDAGTHHIEVRYFENYGHAGLKLEWEGPGIEGRELVTAPGPEDAQTVNGMPIALELQIDPVEGSGTTALGIEGLPEGTVVEAGDDRVTVGPDGAADITGWDMSVMTLTTPLEFVGPIDAAIVTTVTTDSGQAAIMSDALHLQVNPATIEPMPVALVGGFEASYFDVDQTLLQINDIDWSATPTHTEMVREINYENGRGSFWEDGGTDTFGAKLEGTIRVEEGGSYDFHLGGDDGVVLLIDGVEVVEYDGLQSYHTRSGEIDLEPGTHHVEVRYFENYGYAGLKLEWEGPDTDGRELVQADPDLLVPENGILTVGIETEILSDAATIQVQGLPADTIVMTDGASAVSDGGPVDVSGWDIDTIEIAPPPGYVGEISGHIVLEDTAFNGEMTVSTSEFSITVGDVNDGPQPNGLDADIFVVEASGGSGEDANLLVLDDTNAATDAQNDDVMDQPVEHTTDTDCTMPMMDTYERCDW
ncbi:MAG: PA14 domain-containing protein [Rhodobacteraceae bacterium]|nr:PA14 domain-containing protein [Paracoccaceae bacterium]